MKEITAKKAGKLAASTDLSQSRRVSIALKAIYSTIDYAARLGKNSITWAERLTTFNLDKIRSHLVTRGFEVKEIQKTWSLTGANIFKMVIKW